MVLAYPAKVIGIMDGDIIKVLTNKHEQVKIRIAAIDAPEKAQPFGNRSKQAMSDLCFGVTAEISPVTLDRYGRTVADVTCQGKDTGKEMVRMGMAWVYDKYAKGHADLYPLQDAAKRVKLGRS
ncbi:unnamed protein product [Darwinula stevensoni]|uniref:TNase-like domain-containing protein n=1 Tax=Darwinula stevensoni TaxID=69355 RepID=A0A7R9FRV9_9CRUS|nr:unnamed protein product [Darwinula stevensoni]CAG0902205.1 unnamed protein product [Darwinula stevensoni]